MFEDFRSKNTNLPAAKAVAPLKKDKEFLHESISALMFFGLTGMIFLALRQTAKELAGKELVGADAMAIKFMLVMLLIMFVLQMIATTGAIHRLFERASPTPIASRGFLVYLGTMFASGGLGFFLTYASFRLLGVLPVWGFMLLLPVVSAISVPTFMYARRLP